MPIRKRAPRPLAVQRQNGHHFWEPIWYMLPKIRYDMGKRDDHYKLCDKVGLDRVFFETVPDKECRDWVANEFKENDGKYKRGKGSQKQVKVLVMAESKAIRLPGNIGKNRTKK